MDNHLAKPIITQQRNKLFIIFRPINHQVSSLKGPGYQGYCEWQSKSEERG